MLETLLMLLIYAAGFAIIIYVVIYALQLIGVPMPGKIVPLIWLIFGLFVLLWIVRSGVVPFPG